MAKLTQTGSDEILHGSDEILHCSDEILHGSDEMLHGSDEMILKDFLKVSVSWNFEEIEKNQFEKVMLKLNRFVARLEQLKSLKLQQSLFKNVITESVSTTPNSTNSRPTIQANPRPKHE